MKIQLAIIKDVEAIIKVEKETWLDTYPNSKLRVLENDIRNRFSDTSQRIEELKKSISENENSIFLVMKNKDRVVGYSYALKEEEFNDLVELYILPSFQRKGIGTQVMKQLSSWFDKNKDTILEVIDYNLGAITFYNKFGFKKDMNLKQKEGEDWNVLPSGYRLPVIFMRKQI